MYLYKVTVGYGHLPKKRVAREVVSGLCWEREITSVETCSCIIYLESVVLCPVFQKRIYSRVLYWSSFYQRCFSLESEMRLLRHEWISFDLLSRNHRWEQFCCYWLRHNTWTDGIHGLVGSRPRAGNGPVTGSAND